MTPLYILAKNHPVKHKSITVTGHPKISGSQQKYKLLINVIILFLVVSIFSVAGIQLSKDEQ